MHSCCFANQTYCFFDVLAAVDAVVAKAPYYLSIGRLFVSTRRATRYSRADLYGHLPLCCPEVLGYRVDPGVLGFPVFLGVLLDPIETENKAKLVYLVSEKK